jgi:adenylate cyclase class 2
MHREIEIKLRVDAHDALRRVLAGHGGEFRFAGVETNTILDRPDGALRQQGIGLRVRGIQVERGAAVAPTLTAKGPPAPGPLKVRDEHEVAVDSADGTEQLLGALGFAAVLRYAKHRERWVWRGCFVELDDVPHLGRFVEIEGPDAETIAAVRAELGLADALVVPESYVRLVMEFRRARGLDPLTP